MTKRIISNILYSIIFIFSSLIFVKSSPNNQELFQNFFYENNINFASFNNFFTKYFEMINNDKIAVASVLKNDIYSNHEPFLDGEKFYVSSNTPINILVSGVVVYKGEKDSYGYCVIIQGIDGYDYWYGNIRNSDLQLYDYVNANTIVGESNSDYFYLVIKNKNGYKTYESYKS